jgi:transcriptional regulator with XRE-family HTH domain
MARPALAWDPPHPGELIRRARLARGWSQTVVARRIVAIRAGYGEHIGVASMKAQLSRWENGKVTLDRFNMGVIAEVFSTTVDALFGIEASPDLPRPVLLEAHVNEHTVQLLQAQRSIHARTEHSFGPGQAAALVSADLATIEGLLRVTPHNLEGPMHGLAALAAELGGWIAQDCGNLDQARSLTTMAQSYAQDCGDPAIQAMVLMRWANIETAGDPRLAARLAQQAADAVGPLAPGRLHATIARQRAHAAAAMDDRASFDRYAAQAAEYSQAGAGEEELTPYADQPYIASETAAGLLVLGQPAQAVDALADHLSRWAHGQERDHAVALCRWLRALAASGDYTTALDHCESVLVAYRRAPSMHAKSALHAITACYDDTERLPNRELRHRITTALEGTRHP